jgi:hypothetical protein
MRKSAMRKLGILEEQENPKILWVDFWGNAIEEEVKEDEFLSVFMNSF